MLDESNPFTALRLVSWIVWKIPSRRPLKMAGFSHTEAGSSLDMMDAAEETSSPDLRKKFFRHALDEFRHSRLFSERALALSSGTRAADVLEDPEYTASHGIRGEESLYKRLGETEFLGFVWLHERQGAKQFEIYADLMKQDPKSSAMFAEICNDEKFHVEYSRRELDRIEAANRAPEVAKAIRRLRLRGAREAFLRFSHGFGNFMAGFWLLIVYFAVIGPFTLLARGSIAAPGLIPTPGSLTRARAEARVQG
jgi:rubrerythrin